MRDIVVTGAFGFIGEEVCRQLILQGKVPHAFDRPNDVRNRQQVFDAVTRADGVINLAGVLGTAEIFGSEHEASEINILGAINVLDAAQQADIHMVQIATGHEGQPNPYAITKKCATDLCLARAVYHQQKVNVVKAFHVYGPGQKMCAPHGSSKVRKIVPSFVARALTNMDIEINGGGLQVIDLVFLEDAARVLVEALLPPYGRKLDAGTGVPTTVLDAAETIISACHSSSAIKHVPMRIGEPEGSVVLSLHPECHRYWPYGLPETIDWYRHALARAA